MKLYADTVEQQASNKLYALRKSLDVLARILPWRCGNCEGTAVSCPACEGRGFLYPPMPDWFEAHFFPDTGQAEEAWQFHLETVWRAMGITEDTP